MAYTLLHSNNIVVGPRDWNPRYFEHFLGNLGFHIKLPAQQIVNDIHFSKDVRLAVTDFEPQPDFDPTFEVLTGPFFKFDENQTHIGYFTVQAKAAESRWNKETTQINRTIGGKELTLDTDRESRIMYTQAVSLVSDDYTSQWKFNGEFVVINKSDLHSIVYEVMTHVQSCFDWESDKVTEINSKSTIEELKQIILE